MSGDSQEAGWSVSRTHFSSHIVSHAIAMLLSLRVALAAAIFATLAPSSTQAACNLDIDGNGAYDASTDGLLLMRHLVGFSGTALTQGAIGAGATRADSAQIRAFINSQNYDFDGDGAQRGTTDGLLALRYLVGLTGDALIQGAFSIGAARTKSADVVTYLTTSNACLLLPVGIQSLNVSFETDNSVYLMPGEVREVSPQITLASGTAAQSIVLAITSGNAYAVLNQDASGRWSITVTSAGIASGGQTAFTLRVTNTASSRSADLPFLVKVVPATTQSTATISNAGGTINTSTAPIVFGANGLASSATAVVREFVVPGGNVVTTLEFDRDVSTDNITLTLPYLSPSTGSSSSATTAGSHVKAFSPTTLATPYATSSTSLGYYWQVYKGWALEANGGYRIPTETPLMALDLSLTSALVAGSVTLPNAYVVTSTRMQVKQLEVARLYSALPQPASTVDIGAYEPVLFVHGFTLDIVGFGGGEGTWGKFPALALDSVNLGGKQLIPFEFQWRTNAHFKDAAADLALAIKKIHDATNKRVHVVAHSFGGLLVRSLLQGHVRGLPSGSTIASEARAAIASLITLDTPHSGILPSASTVNGVAFPDGQDSLDFEHCDQVSCHVAGQVFGAAGSSSKDVATRNVLGVQASPGEHAALLATTVSQLPAIRIKSAIGLRYDISGPAATSPDVYHDGDGLLTYRSQRFSPLDTVATPLRVSSSIGAALVTESVLGTTRTVAPGDAPNSAETSDPKYLAGYCHTEVNCALGFSIFSGWAAKPTADKNCSNGASCKHAGYLLLKDAFANNGWVGDGTGRLNDTGITFSGDYPSGNNAACTGSNNLAAQDCSLGRDASSPTKVGDGYAGFDFTKISNSGNPLPASAVLGSGPSDWACTRDNVTGLVWEVKATSGLRNMNHTYTWYSSDSTNNGGSVGAASGGTCQTPGRCDTEKYVQDVNTVVLCGHTDWRMPHVKELSGLVDFGQSNPAIDLSYFPNTLASIFWSGSPGPSKIKVVNFGYGDFSFFDPGYSLMLRGDKRLVRVVRSGQ